MLYRQVVISLFGTVVAAAIGCGDNLAPPYIGELGEPTPISFVEWVPGVPVDVAASGPKLFMVDTGSYYTGIDTDSYADYELANGVHALPFSALGVSVPTWPMMALDLFRYRIVGAAPFHGVVGGDFLSQFAVSLDYQRAQIWVEEGLDVALPLGLDPVQVADPVEVAARVSGGGVLVDVPGDCLGSCGQYLATPTRFLVAAYAEGEPVTLMVDTGATFSVLSQSVFDRLGGLVGRPHMEIVLGTADGAVNADVTRLLSLRVAGDDALEQINAPVIPFPAALLEPLAREVGQPIDGVLGASFLREFQITLDYPGQRMRLARYRSTSHVDPREYVGLGLRMDRNEAGDWFVSRVLAGTDAELQRVGASDLVLELGGVRLHDRSAGFVSELIASFEIGERIELLLRRLDGETYTRLVIVEDLLPPISRQ